MMGSEKTAPRLRARTTGEILDLVPHLLGFHPTESLVVMVVDAGVVVVTARVDLVEVAPDGEVEDLLRRIWARFPSAGAWVLAYTADAAAGWGLLRRCETFLGRAPLCRLTLVSGDTWRSDGPGGPGGIHDPGHGPLAAAAAFHGLPARRTRAELEACFDPPDEADLPHLLAVVAAVTADLAEKKKGRWPAELAQAVRAHLDGDTPEEAVAVRLALLACHPPAQETALLLVTPQDAARHVTLWQTVVNRVPPEYSGDALALAGVAGWIAGEGAVVTICLDRLTGKVTNPALPELLRRVCTEVAPPSLWPGLRARLLAGTTPTIRRAVSRPGGRRDR